MQETYAVGNEDVNYYFSQLQLCMCVFVWCVFVGCVCVCLSLSCMLAYLRQEYIVFLPLYPSKGLCCLERDTVYFLVYLLWSIETLIGSCHSIGWSTNANLSPDCSIVICIPNQTADFHYKLLPCFSLSRIPSFFLSPYSFLNNDPLKILFQEIPIWNQQFSGIKS